MGLKNRELIRDCMNAVYPEDLKLFIEICRLSTVVVS